MQRIDVMLSLIKDNVKLVLPIELKSVEASTDNIIQIQRYVDWLEQYYIPNRISDILPVLISKKVINKNSGDYRNIIESFKQFNQKNSCCLPLKYIEYELDSDISNQLAHSVSKVGLILRSHKNSRRTFVGEYTLRFEEIEYN